MTLPLPLIDNCLYIDNSQIEQFMTCPTAWYYTNVLKRTLNVDGLAVRFGSAVHKALETRYANPSFDVITDEASMIQAGMDYLTNHPVPDEGWRNGDMLLDVIVKYNKQYPFDDFTVVKDHTNKPFVERSFAIPLATYDYNGQTITVIYTGRLDLFIKQNDRLFVEDHKTSSILGPSYFDDMNVGPAFPGYMWAVNKLTGEYPIGYIVNVLGCRQPTKTGKSVEFIRQTFFKPWTYIEEWKSNLLLLIDELLFHAKRGQFPLKRKWCVGKFGKCPFYDVDSLPPTDRPGTLSSGMFKEYTWSPLNKD